MTFIQYLQEFGNNCTVLDPNIGIPQVLAFFRYQVYASSPYKSGYIIILV